MHSPNVVDLVGFYGGDESHALSAWTSTGRALTDERRARMGKLLTALAQDGHHTPFEKSTLHFLVTCEQASHIHILKHRIAVAVNGESARYKELKDNKYYVPGDWPEHLQNHLSDYCTNAIAQYHRVLAELEPILGRKRAKESARFYLPYASQLTLDVAFNFRSFMHFQGLRNKPDAQAEINDIAQDMLEIVQGLGVFNQSLEAFGYGA